MAAKLRSVLRQQTLGALALFVALGGTSYAVATGSIDSREIKNNAVRSKDIRNNDVRSKDVRNGTLLAEDFGAGQLPAGEKGDPGATGPPGPQGAQGPPGLSGVERIFASSGAATSSSPKQVSVPCPAGKRAIGGGYDLVGAKTGSAPDGVTDIVADVALPSGEGVVPGSFFVEAWEEDATGATWSIDAFAICANTSL